MKGKYRFVPGGALLALSLISMMTESVPAWIGPLLLVAAAVLVIFASRGTVKYTKAVKLFNSGDPVQKIEAVKLMDRAIDYGLSAKESVVAATVLLQNGKEEKAKPILENLIRSTDRSVSGPALASLSMYCWMEKDYSRAIELCEKAKQDGYTSRNLYVNLLTYYLAAGKTREFSSLLEEMGTSGASSPAIVDFHAVNEMLHGRWKQAGAFLEALCVEAVPGFPDPYIHFAQVYLHYGDLANARKMLGEALDSDYARYSVYTIDMVKEMLRAISDSHECVPFTEAANRDNKAILKIVNGRLPSWEKSNQAFDQDMIPGYPEEPSFREIIEEAAENDDTRDANTDLDETDEKWLSRHQS